MEDSFVHLFRGSIEEHSSSAVPFNYYPPCEEQSVSEYICTYVFDVCLTVYIIMTLCVYEWMLYTLLYGVCFNREFYKLLVRTPSLMCHDISASNA